MKLYLNLILLMLIGLVSCQESTKDPASGDKPSPSKVAQLADEVIGIHDAVMPKLEEIQAHVERLEALKEKRLKAAAQTRIERTLKELQQADDAMMTWMRGYKIPIKDDPRSEAELLEYLAQEKTKIIEVKNLMLNSLSEAQKIGK